MFNNSGKEQRYCLNRIFWLEVKCANGKIKLYPFVYDNLSNVLFDIKGEKSYRADFGQAHSTIARIEYSLTRFTIPNEVCKDYEKIGTVEAFYTEFEMESITNNALYNYIKTMSIACIIPYKDFRDLNVIYFEKWFDNKKATVRELNRYSKIYSGVLEALSDDYLHNNQIYFYAMNRVSYYKFLKCYDKNKNSNAERAL